MSRLRERVNLEKCRQLAAANPDSAGAHLRLGTALMKVGFAGKAEASLARAVELDPTCIQGWVNLGGLRLGRWDFQGCIEANRRALEQQPDLVEALFNKGLGHLYAGDTEAMLDCFRRVVELDPGRGGGQYFLAVGLLATGDIAGAEEHLGRAVGLGYSPHPDFVKAMERVAREDSVTVLEFGPESKHSA